MPQTTVPEEQKRANDLDDLRNNIWPTENRVAFLEGQATPNDGLANLYWWDSDGDPNNSNAPNTVASAIPQFGVGGTNSGLWRRTFTPVGQLTTDDIDEGSQNLYYTDTRARTALSAGGDLSYNPATGEFSVTTYTSDDFDDDFSLKSTDALTEGSNNLYFTDERAQDAVNLALTGGKAIEISYDDAANTSTVALDGDFSRTVFSGNGTANQFQIAHGLGEKPAYWIVNATTDDASGISHVTADSTNINVNYDTAPPSGTDNVVLNWLAVRGNVAVQIADSGDIQTV